MVSDRQKVGKYYSIFINTMALLVKNYGGKIVKNAGDALIFYFPKTPDPANESAFDAAFECFTTMTLARNIINAKLHSENLPSVSYRISADYGKVEVATSTSSKSEDLFGSTMNICSKINSMAEPNGIVIGGDLHQIIQSFSFADQYEFKQLQEGYSTGFSKRYPVYCALNANILLTDINKISQLFRSKETSINKDLQFKKQLGALNPQHQQVEEQVQQSQRQQKGPFKVMVVDDEQDTLYTYRYLLSAEGYNVQAFTDSQEALKHFVQLQDPSSYYHLVLLDIRMPRLNGLQLFYRIKAVSPDTTIMFCSALDIAEELVSILPGITHAHILKKPLRRGDFISRIKAAVATNNNNNNNNNHQPLHSDGLSA
jgi:two-component system response regulator ChvI